MSKHDATRLPGYELPDSYIKLQPPDPDRSGRAFIGHLARGVGKLLDGASFEDPRQALICWFPGGGAGVFVGTPSQCAKKRAEIEAEEPGATFELQPAPGGSPQLPQNPDR